MDQLIATTHFFSPNPRTYIYDMLTDGMARMIFSPTIFTIPPDIVQSRRKLNRANTYTACDRRARERWHVSLVIQTHASRFAPDWDLWRTLSRLSCSAAAWKLTYFRSTRRQPHFCSAPPTLRASSHSTGPQEPILSDLKGWSNPGGWETARPFEGSGMNLLWWRPQASSKLLNLPFHN